MSVHTEKEGLGRRETLGRVVWAQAAKAARMRGLSVSAAAEKAGITKTVVSMWGTGKSSPSATSLLALADYFNVSADWLMSRLEFLESREERDTTRVIRTAQTAALVEELAARDAQRIAAAWIALGGCRTLADAENDRHLRRAVWIINAARKALARVAHRAAR